MTKLMVLIARHPGLSAEEFRRHFEERHIPLVRALPGLRRLVVNYAVADPMGGEPTYDAIAEDWFDGPKAMGAALGSPEGQAVAADEPNFQDMGRVRVIIVDESDASSGR